MIVRWLRLPAALLLLLCAWGSAPLGAALDVGAPLRLSRERAVMQTSFGDLQLAFYPDVAPITVPHIIALFRSGCYNSDQFFRVDKGFVAQVSDVVSGRLAPLSPLQREEAETAVPLEVVTGVQHHAGTLSMARHADPNSGKSSFSVLLGDAPHLNMQYTVFGTVTDGMEAVRKMEGVPTRKQGIFVMPLERITIHSTFMIYVADPQDTVATAWSFRECDYTEARLDSLLVELQATRERCLPG